MPVGLGSYVHWDRKLDGLLAGALMSIQAVKAVEIGDGMAQASQRGSVSARRHRASTRVRARRRVRAASSDHAGGLEGGMTSGAPLIAKVAMKPLATLNRPVLETVDVATGESTVSFKERTDVTAVPALGRRHRGDDGASAGQRGAAKVRRRLGGGVRSQSRDLRRESRIDVFGRATRVIVARLVLVGLPGSGKTTRGERSRAPWSVDFVDTDDLFLAREG